MAGRKRPCKVAGCETLTAGLSGYCEKHHAAAKKCRIDGCENLVAGWSVSGCCKDHRLEGRRLRP